MHRRKAGVPGVVSGHNFIMSSRHGMFGGLVCAAAETAQRIRQNIGRAAFLAGTPFGIMLIGAGYIEHLMSVK
jgi:hypothetical protein